MNSTKQLHGNAPDVERPATVFDKDCYCMRFIPYGRTKVLGFVQRRLLGDVQGEAFWDIKMNEHSALDSEKLQVGDVVSAKFGKNKKLYKATLVEEDGDLCFRWLDGSSTKVARSKVFSRHCLESDPHECIHCNPSFCHSAHI